MICVVIDTRVLIRYLIKPSAAIRELIEERWLSDEVRMVSAPELIAELESVLARGYIQALIRPEEGPILADTLCRKAEILSSLGISTYTPDPKDDKFAGCAIAGQAARLIAADEDLLTLGSGAGVQIVSPWTFVTTWKEGRRNTGDVR